MDITLIALLSGASIALVVYDIAARLKHQRELTETLLKLNNTHNGLVQSFQVVSDQVSRMEMLAGVKSKPASMVR